MSDAKISIIVPVYNVEKYLSQCIESIISQPCEGAEIILVDDGSTDQSGFICDSYSERDKRIKVIHQKNMGPSEARNAGIKAAKATYLMFVDSDDFISSSCLQKIINMLAEDQEIDIIAGSFIKYYEDSEIEKPRGISQEIINSLVQVNAQETFANLIKNSVFTPSAGTNIFRRNLFVNNNIFFKQGLLCEDVECIPKLFLFANKITMLNEVYYYYRQNRKGSTTNKSSVKRVNDLLYVIKEWLQILQDKSINDRLKEQLIDHMTYQYAIATGLLFSCKRKQKKSIFLEMKQYQYLFKNGISKKTIIVKNLYKILGYKMTGEILAYWIRYKGKSEIH